MKLFKSLLVAPAALGLLAPMTATANELNLNDVSGYSSSEEVQNISEFNSAELAVTNSRVDGLEARLNNYEAGSFSSTTAASFSVDMAIGAVDGNNGSTDEEVVTAYGYQIDLSTSFTGEDALSVSLDAGSGGSSLGELDLNSGGDQLTVDGVTYTFPVGEKLTVLVGDSTDGSALYSTACVYGGFTNTLDDCGNYSSAFTSPSNGATLSASYDIGNGFTGAFGYAGEGTSDGLMTKAGTDMFGGQLSYAADTYGLSVTYANIEDSAKSYGSGTGNPEFLNETSYWGLNAYWTPDSTGSVPSISVGYESGDVDGSESLDTTQWFVGFQWDEVGPGTLGIAAGSNGAITDSADELMAYEAFYSYPVNDGMTITPAVFIMENATGTDDETGIVVKTSFSF